jgi:hypothetical protein
MRHLLTTFLLTVTTSVLHAHHTGWGVVTRSAKCGWLEGDNVRDVTNVSTFCVRYIPAGLQIQGVTANREQLWIDAPPELAAMLRENDATTEALLKEWQERWKTISGYRTASVILLRGHGEIASAGTTMSGDFVRVR